MNKTINKSGIIILLVLFSCFYTQAQIDSPWEAQWINCRFTQSASNTWNIARRTLNISKNFKKSTIRMAVDSKYWLWINGRLVVFEGGLKRGPNPKDTYYDEFEVGQYLQEGENVISILYWYFGKDSFSHISSGKSGLIFELFLDNNLVLKSDKNWFTMPHPAYKALADELKPNWRLAESDVVFDAQLDNIDWKGKSFEPNTWSGTMEIGSAGCSPWNNLVRRPIPLWKDYGLKEYLKTERVSNKNGYDTIKCYLPYNAQITSYLKVKARTNSSIKILTDNYSGGGELNVKATYICKEGIQEYESYGWMNGHYVMYIIPKEVEIIALKYRETGYDTEFTGSFQCEQEDLNTLWKKAQRTLYITMRDSYMDCPDRERAQWSGDAVNEIGESFYALCPQSHLLAKKFYLETMDWQKKDSSIFGPVPASNWDQELPMQMLNTVGHYGIWDYFLHTGDTLTIKKVFPKIKKYLVLWKFQPNGILAHRAGGWDWGDWGENIDMPIVENSWYYLACKAYLSMSNLLGNQEEKTWAEQRMKLINSNFNKTFWTGKEYRSPSYTQPTDDRANALAVLAGFAQQSQYDAIGKVFQNNYHASPYMEKYVLEALWLMDKDHQAIERLLKRFSKMIKSPLTTLWEGWGIGKEGYGGGTYNHAWSGGGLTLLSQFVAGITPSSIGFDTIQVKPRMGNLKYSAANIETVKAKISVSNKWVDIKNFQQVIDCSKESNFKLFGPLKNKKIKAMTINNVKVSSALIHKINTQSGIVVKGQKVVLNYWY
ncbi:MAG: glycoside hydrolase [Cytophagales bacterium]|nr:MAG: glycoside hydrolase [Cytophagales bacterium]